MIKSKNAELGSVYAIKTNIGYGLFQVVQNKESGIDVVRVLQSTIQNIDQFSPSVLQGTERYFIKFTVQSAFKKKLITFIGKYNIPSSVKIPKKFRMLDCVPHKNIRNWYVVDAKTNSLKLVTSLNKKILSLSSDGIWNDTFLIERIEEGWTLENWK